MLPYESNLKKRMVKSPKIFIKDSGLLHAILNIESHNDLLGHPVYGSSWEGFVIENILAVLPDWTPFFYRTSSGTEIDLILEKGSKRIAIECKVSSAPNMSNGFWKAINDLKFDNCWIIAPVKDTYPIKKNINVTPLEQFLKSIKSLSA